VNEKLCILGLCAGLGVFGCSASSTDDLSKPPGHGGSSGNGASGATSSGGASGAGIATGLGGSNLGINVGDASPGTGGSTGNGMPETCDGVDNDGNGIVDDVDVGKDGVCDCLNIATVGEIGPWGMGTGVFTTWLSSRSPLGAVALGDQVLTDDILKKFQVIVTLHTQTVDVSNKGQTAHAHHAFLDPEIQAFARWVKAGGGAMATIGYNYGGTEEEININKLFAPLGITYKPKGYITNFITRWEPHPVTEGVLNIYTSNGVETNGEGIVLAHESPQKVAFQGIEVEKGRALMWGDEWITYDDLWTDVKDQQVERLWLNILKWLTPAKQCQVPIPDRIN
jgi:hypothetical protein